MKVGDMFVVVKRQLCCGADAGVGVVGEILALRNECGTCRNCGATTHGQGAAFMYRGRYSWVAQSRIRILPPDIDVAETEREEVA